MAKGNGRLTGKSVSVWFSAMPFDEQAVLLGKLKEAHDKTRLEQIDTLRRQLAALENGSANNGGTARVTTKRGSKKDVKVKYRDPKTGDTWSGRGRMARWLADKVKSGEKRDKYLLD